MNRYFRLQDDMQMPERWLLGKPMDAEGCALDVWQFLEGRRLELPEGIRIPQLVRSRPVDFAQGPWGMPVVHERVVRLFERLGLQAQVQCFPVEVEGCSEPHAILNVLRVIPCVDDARCEQVEYWKPEDNRPEKLGGYQMIHGLRIDASQPGDAHIFRPQGWLVALLVSERLKQALEAEGVTGAGFTPV